MLQAFNKTDDSSNIHIMLKTNTRLSEGNKWPIYTHQLHSAQLASCLLVQECSEVTFLWLICLCHFTAWIMFATDAKQEQINWNQLYNPEGRICSAASPEDIWDLLGCQGREGTSRLSLPWPSSPGALREPSPSQPYLTVLTPIVYTTHPVPVTDLMSTSALLRLPWPGLAPFPLLRPLWPCGTMPWDRALLQARGFSPSRQRDFSQSRFHTSWERSIMRTGYEAIISICKEESTKEEMRTNFHMYSPF